MNRAICVNNEISVLQTSEKALNLLPKLSLEAHNLLGRKKG
jgi:hypothetical protein